MQQGMYRNRISNGGCKYNESKGGHGVWCKENKVKVHVTVPCIAISYVDGVCNDLE